MKKLNLMGAALFKAFVTSTAALAIASFPVETATFAQTQKGPDSVADLAESLLDSVVNISTSQNIGSEERRAPVPRLPEGSPFQDFFDEFFKDNDRGSPRGPRRVNSLGSGFVIDAKEGIIITNNHVIAEADEITINFSDGDKLDAEIIGKDPKTDIAVLKVDPSQKELKAVPFGDSEKARIGDWVMAIGNPFGLGGTVTVGIISAQNRNINSGPYDRFIQTDASINRGNSGGPLFNMDGEVIGINTAIISPSGGSIGIGFAIPSELATNVISQLREFGETRRGWLGVRIQPVTDEIAESIELGEARGAMVAGIIEGGPVEDGPIEPGDVILKFDGKEIEEMRDLPRIVADSPVGKDVEVELFRKGESKTVIIKLGRLEDNDKKQSEDQSEDEVEEKTVLGMTLSELSDKLREAQEIEEGVQGVLITKVDPNSHAAEKRVSEGDVIAEVAQEVVKTPDDVIAQIDKLKEEGRKNALLMLSSKSGELRFVTVRVK